MKLPPLEVIATWPAPNYVNPQTQGEALLIVNSVFLGIATVVFVLRLYTRLFIKKWFGWDDGFIILAYLFTVGVNVGTDFGIKRYGWGRHIWDIPIQMASASYKLVYATKLLFLCADFFTASSLLAFYYRIGRESDIKWFIAVLHAGTAFNIVAWLPFVFAQVFICVPVQAYWSLPEPKGSRCMDEGPVVLAGGAVKVLVDLVITTLPIPLIMRLNMDRQQRMGIVILLALGYLVTVAGAFRTYFTWEVFWRTTDLTWYQNRAFIAGAIENDVAIIVACLPTIRPLMKMLPRMPFGYLRDRVRSLSGRSTLVDSAPTSHRDHSATSRKPLKTNLGRDLNRHFGPLESIPPDDRLSIHTRHSDDYEVSDDDWRNKQ